MPNRSLKPVFLIHSSQSFSLSFFHIPIAHFYIPDYNNIP